MKKLYLILLSLSLLCTVQSQTKVPLSTANKHFGETVTICDQLFGENLIADIQSKTSLLLLGSTTAEQIAVVLPELSKQKISKNKYFYLGKQVCITGKLTLANGKKELIISSESDIKLCKSNSTPPDIKPNDFMRFE